MGERKVQNKYYDPSFDPAKLPRGKRKEQGRMEMRMMLPFSCQCHKCGEFMYRGTKFNSKKEDVLGEDYMGIKIFRLIMKCPQCNAFFSIKTDPKNSDYVAEHGASRNFEPWREQRAEVAQAKVDREEEEKVDAIRALELRTEDSRRQLEMLDDLEELRDLKGAQGEVLGLTPAEILARGAGGAGSAAAAAADVEQEDEAAARAAFLSSARRKGNSWVGSGGAGAGSAGASSSASAIVSASAAAPLIEVAGRKRPREEEEGPSLASAAQPVRAPAPSALLRAAAAGAVPVLASRPVPAKALLPFAARPGIAVAAEPPAANAGGGGGLVGYDSDDSD